jgi:hypothetical protein
MDYNWHNFPNMGVVSTQFTEDQLKPIKDEIKKIQNNFESAEKANDVLVGHLKHEYHLVDSKDYIDSLLRPLIACYEEQYGYLNLMNYCTNSCPLDLHDVWVNFQKKHEFNPPHNHSGVFSFVIWIQMPFLNADERAQFPDVTPENNRTSSFMFQYINSLGKISYYNLAADKTWENTVYMFPAEMMHLVLPFYTSDEYRISISGNFKLKT